MKKVNKRIFVLAGNRCTFYRNRLLIEALVNREDIDVSFTTIESRDMPYPKAQLTNTISIPDKYKTDTLQDMSLKGSFVQQEVTKILIEDEIDLVLVLADRWEQLSVTTAASYLNIPIAHIQGGELSGNIDDKIRKAISMFSDIHFPSHQNAGERLSTYGCRDIFVYGCPSLDIITRSKINTSKTKGHIICIFHPHTKELDSIRKQSNMLLEQIDKYTKEFKIKCYWFSNNDDAGYENVKVKIKDNEYIQLVDTVVDTEYLQLLASAKFIIGNSSSGIREASFLGIPSINIGKRQNKRICASNVITIGDMDPYTIYENMCNIKKRSKKSTLFGDGNSVDRIVKKLVEYI